MVRRLPYVPVLAVVALMAGFSVAVAQDLKVRQHHHARRHPALVAAASAPVAYRGLTISRPPEAAPSAGDDEEIYQDGPVRYNDVRDFSPAPYATSGVQFPYGLDGIGGYGSDLDFGAGQDTAVYDRGAGTRP